MEERFENEKNLLSKETSPYLLQHANNPVNWVSWDQSYFEKAKAENKLVLISVGYSSCHWCHVMEKESFEDESVAALMNENFICIKVDREERPDVDQVYMDAVQLMSGQGGWPLNCFTMPNGVPIYGGTYFRKDQWINILGQLSDLWEKDPQKVQEYGEAVRKGMDRKPILPKVSENSEFSTSILHESINAWKNRTDKVYGGPNRAPKFPMPVNYKFLMNYGFYTEDQSIIDFVDLTLKRMARGGIYDQVGGGFTRYSTDIYWKVPHFEKMLYDNAQLLDLFSQAALIYKNPEYENIAKGIVEWLEREMKSSEGGYYSAIDADSEGVEGKFYVWSEDEILPNYDQYYETGEEGYWEGNLIPVRKFKDEFSENYLTGLDELNHELLKIRDQRVRPITDIKVITSWNALLISGLSRSSRHLNLPDFLAKGEELADFIKNDLYEADSGKLYHHITSGKRSEESFFEDYAFFIEALIELNQTSGNFEYMEFAKELSHIAIDRFYDDASGVFLSTDINSTELVSAPFEITDNVIPASNSIMASNLNILGNVFGNVYLQKLSQRLLSGMKEGIVEYGEGYGNWMNLWLKTCIGHPEIVITGPESGKRASDISQYSFPLAFLAHSSIPNSSELFKGRFNSDKTLIHICRNNTCQLPHQELALAKAEIDEIIDDIKTTLAS